MKYIVTLKDRIVEIETSMWGKLHIIDDYLTVWHRDTPNDPGYQGETLSGVQAIRVVTRRVEDIAKDRGLKLFNGRSHLRDYKHVYICAKSMAEANRLMQQAYGHKNNFLSEIKNYFNKGCWGNSMQHIEPEVGLWAQKDHNSKPERLI